MDDKRLEVEKKERAGRGSKKGQVERDGRKQKKRGKKKERRNSVSSS